MLQRQLHAKTSSTISAVTEHEFLPSKKKHPLQFTNTQGAVKIGSATEISEILFLMKVDIKLSQQTSTTILMTHVTCAKFKSGTSKAILVESLSPKDSL